MTKWTMQDAKARFSELLETTLAQGPQMVTKRGVDAAVLVPVDDWRRLEGKRSAMEVLLGPGPRFDLRLPKRGTGRGRMVSGG